MNPAQLLTHFERISEAPDAIPRLRRFVLDLAVRGKLVEQDPRDEPASELLKRIGAEKARLKASAIRKEKSIPALEQNDVPFRLPNNWYWSQLAEVGFINPRNTAADELPVSFVPMPLISAEYGVASKHEIRPWAEIKSGYTHFAEGDVALAKITPCFENGKSTVFRGLTGGLGAGTTELHVLRPIKISADYILLFLKSPYFIESGIPGMTGTAGQKRVPIEYFAYSPFPLPPFAEQQRIVAKVDELMALCDQLEAVQMERESRRDRLAAATHASLSNSSSHIPQSIFFINHLPRITNRPEHIQQLRQTILNLAVRGQLIPQDPNDKPASQILGGHELFLDSESEQWKLPSGWAWSSFELIGETLGGGTPSKSDSNFWNGSIPWVSPKDMKVDVIRDAQDHISESAIEHSSTRLIPTRSLLMVVRGMILAHSFPTGISAVPLTINQDMKAIVPFRPDLISMLLLLTKGLKPEVLRLVLRSTHGTCKLLTADLFSLPIPIPPLAEQQRIVAKVDELMALCDRLEAQLTTTQTENRRLVEAILAEGLQHNVGLTRG